jgi:hypothetical protein
LLFEWNGVVLALVVAVVVVGATAADGVDRYEGRRDTLVTEANAIGTTWLRAQTLAEPERSESLVLLRGYVDLRIELSHRRIGTDGFDAMEAAAQQTHRDLWARAGAALARAPADSAPRLYVETLTSSSTPTPAGSPRSPTASPIVVDLQIGGSALAWRRSASTSGCSTAASGRASWRRSSSC